MTARQRLFNYFQQEHDIMLLDSDFNEVVEIMKPDIIASHEAGQWDNEIDIAYLTGVFNVVGLDGLSVEIDRLKKIGKQPHDIFDAFRKLPAPYQEKERDITRTEKEKSTVNLCDPLICELQ